MATQDLDPAPLPRALPLKEGFTMVDTVPKGRRLARRPASRSARAPRSASSSLALGRERLAARVSEM